MDDIKKETKILMTQPPCGPKAEEAPNDNTIQGINNSTNLVPVDNSLNPIANKGNDCLMNDDELKDGFIPSTKITLRSSGQHS